VAKEFYVHLSPEDEIILACKVKNVGKEKYYSDVTFKCFFVLFTGCSKKPTIFCQ